MKTAQGNSTITAPFNVTATPGMSNGGQHGLSESTATANETTADDSVGRKDMDVEVDGNVVDLAVNCGKFGNVVNIYVVVLILISKLALPTTRNLWAPARGIGVQSNSESSDFNHFI